MAEWTPEAEQYLEEYLRRVGEAAYPESSGTITSMRPEVRREAEEAAAGGVVTADHVRAVVSGREKQAPPPEDLAPDAAFPATPAGAAATPPPPPPMPQRPAATREGRSTGWLIGCAVGAGCLILLIIFGGIFAAIMLPAFNRAREATNRASCANNLKQFGIILIMYASENRGQYPGLMQDPVRPMMNPDAIYPEYLVDTAILYCPSDEVEPPSEPVVAFANSSYLYTPYVLEDGADAEAYVAALRELEAAGSLPEGDYTAPDGTVLTRIQDEGDDGPLPDGAPFVMIDTECRHLPRGGNFLDEQGSVSWMHCGQDWPMTEELLAPLSDYLGHAMMEEQQ